MKRSRTAILIAMGTAPVLLTACGPGEQTREGLYTSLDACTADGNELNACRTALAQAQAAGDEASPQYAARAECEQNHGEGQCEERRTATGHSFFGPFVTGFFLSQLMRGGQPVGLAQGAPAFRDASGGFTRPVAPGGGVYRAGSGRPAGFAPVTATPNQAVTTARGGFGRSAGGRAYGG
ncbi:DUF1190 domain-containing protein [Coralloluteibacterium stylophorae]|uniref:DUF1190 domain-containing protein n=1 Tax=Coralloluteibacterium stylophorae TaxID=1776034 RepID=A0A8J7VT42_9GAMM|nr:DUF1190 domain-containing protein [Coralloluteibacterium stylophorae]MBS7458638.1 DUF1190 domain-containing protein [Coralloluteibacterium stylophorae]